MTLQDQFDVFLCHNSKDKAEIKQIGQQLKQQGLQPWLDEWEFRPGSLFATTREILKQAGPDIGASHRSVGRIAITVLNRGLRPFLAKWHPLLQSWETQRPFDISPFEHEKNWKHQAKLKSELELLRQELEEYAVALAVIASVDYSF